MNGRKTIIAMIVYEASEAIRALMQETPDVSIEFRMKAATESAKQFFMNPTMDEQFLGAVGALLTTVRSEEEKDRITKELKSIQALGAVIAGVPVDFEKAVNLENPIGLMGIFTL